MIIMINPTMTVGTTKYANNPIISISFSPTFNVFAQPVKHVDNIQNLGRGILIWVRLQVLQHHPHVQEVIPVSHDAANFG
jgi:hypothetical protein